MTFRPRLSTFATLLAMVAVLGAYVFFASNGTWEFRRVQWFGSNYAGLAAGFLEGQLSMLQVPDPRLGQVENPYDEDDRLAARIEYLWDTSYYRGRYYLYFTPLPAIVFFIPFKLVSGGYPTERLAAVFFSAWAFLAAVWFIRRALAMSGRKPTISFALWTLLLGLGGIVPFTLTHIRVYEVAILCGTAMSAMWACTLLRFMETRAPKHAAWIGFWLAMSIAARPNVGVLLLITAATILFPWEKRSLKAAAYALVPLAVTGLTMAWYNYARFGNLFEFGIKYQLTFIDMSLYRVCSLCSWPEAVRVVNSATHYLFWGPSVGSEFPFADLQNNRLDPSVSFPGGSEQVVGVFTMVPLTLLGTLFALLFVLRKSRDDLHDLGTRASMRIMLGAFLVLLGLSACWWVVARYALDFMLLIVMATVVCVETGLVFLERIDVRVRPVRIACVLAAWYSILLGFFLGFNGPQGMFKEYNRELHEKLYKLGTQRPPELR